ncbi:MAG: restriction endonuclease, partial [Prevotella sp.]|nr:restriction endonuclease [Prevotella sp.]
MVDGYNLLVFVLVVVLILCVVFGIIKKQRHKKKTLHLSMNQIDALTGIQFENLLEVYFKKLGYKVKTTKVTSDYGADLILTRNGKTTVVQAKRYKNKVGLKAIQEVVASKAVYNAESAIVVTNNYFTSSAWELAKANHVYLIDRNKLIKIQKDV